MTGAGPALGCYTSALLAYLRERTGADPAGRLTRAVDLAVRTDLPPGQVAFSQHARWDGHDGRALAYAGAAAWAAAEAGLRAEADRSGTVLAVGNTRTLPWSPSYGRRAGSHWLLVRPGRAGWTVEDPFAALLPEGEQVPYAGGVDTAGLRLLLTPVGDAGPHRRTREEWALGEPVSCPPPGAYRWLVPEADPGGRSGTADPADRRLGPGRWTAGTPQTLEWLADHLPADPGLLPACLDDLWAAGRHHVAQARLRAADGTAPHDTDALVKGWADLPQALRFAADSAARDRPRPGLVRASLLRLAEATRAARPSLPEACHA